MKGAKHPHLLTRGELQFLDRALLAGEVVIALAGVPKSYPRKDGALSPEGLADIAKDYAVALLRQRRLIRAHGI